MQYLTIETRVGLNDSLCLARQAFSWSSSRNWDRSTENGRLGKSKTDSFIDRRTTISVWMKSRCFQLDKSGNLEFKRRFKITIGSATLSCWGES